MTGRIYHIVSILFAAASLLTGRTGKETSEPETPTAQTQTTVAQTAPLQEADAGVTNAAEQQSAESDDPSEERVPVPEVDIIIDPENPSSRNNRSSR